MASHGTTLDLQWPKVALTATHHLALHFVSLQKKEATEKEVPSLVGAMGKYNDILSPSNIL